MSDLNVDGLAAAYSLMDRIPIEAEHKLADEMARIGRDVLAAQKADVAKDTGELAAGLSMQLMFEQLRVRVGLLGVKASSKSAIRRAKIAGRSVGTFLGDLFHGRFVEFGRRAQTVLVERRRRVGKLLRTQARGSRKRASDVVATYSMKVRAMAPRPFVHVDRPQIRAEQRLANFWAEVVGNTRSAA